MFAFSFVRDRTFFPLASFDQCRLNIHIFTLFSMVRFRCNVLHAKPKKRQSRSRKHKFPMRCSCVVLSITIFSICLLLLCEMCKTYIYFSFSLQNEKRITLRCRLFTGTYESFFSFDTIYISPRNTNEMCTNIVRQQQLLASGNRDHSTLSRIHQHQSMCHCIVCRVFLECQAVGCVCKSPAMFPSKPNLYCQALCDLDYTASIGNDICKENEQHTHENY